MVRIREFVAATPEAYQALWQFAMSVDLTRKVTFRFAQVDEPLVYLVNEPRALEAKFTDSLWVRLLSVPEALSARRYAAPVDVVLEVADRDIPANAGRWRLVGGSEQPAVRVPTSPPTCGSMSPIWVRHISAARPWRRSRPAAGGVELTPGSLARTSVGLRLAPPTRRHRGVLGPIRLRA